MREFIIMLLACSVTMSVLAGIYLAATPFLSRRYAANGIYHAWIVFLIGFIVPFRPRFDNPLVQVISTDTTLPVIRMGAGTQLITPAAGDLPHAGVPSIALIWWKAAVIVWLAGMVAFLVYHVAKHRRFLAITKRWSERITEKETTEQFESIRKELGIAKEIDLYRCCSIGTPLLVGVVRPRILLPDIAFDEADLRFILRHELIHYKRKDLWMKCLVLFATAMHWFNPFMYVIARAIDAQCELSCDAEVVRRTDADTRQQYSEAIIGVARYQSKMKTALSTNFYGGMKGMKKRIFSIMDMRNKKTGAAILCGALLFTMATGFAFAANTETQDPPAANKQTITVSPWISVSLDKPNPDLYAAYAAFGLTLSEDGADLLYQGQPVRLFVDENAPSQAFYLNESGRINLSAVRNDANQVTGLEQISAQKAQEYQNAFFADELGYQKFGITFSEANDKIYFHGERVNVLLDQLEAGYLTPVWEDAEGTVNAAVKRDASGQITGIERISDEAVRNALEQAEAYQQSVMEKEMDTVQVNDAEGPNLFEQYQAFGVTASAAEDAVFFNGQRVRLLVDADQTGWFRTFWQDNAGTVDLEVVRDASGQITGIAELSKEQAQTYIAAAG